MVITVRTEVLRSLVTVKLVSPSPIENLKHGGDLVALGTDAGNYPLWA